MPLVVTAVALDGFGQAAYPRLQVARAFTRGRARATQNAVRAMV
mgnify:CR=1 FL=1